MNDATRDLPVNRPFRLPGSTGTIGVAANQRPRACVPTVTAVGGPGSCRTQRSESDMAIVPPCPDSTPPVPLSECIAELAEALGIEVA